MPFSDIKPLTAKYVYQVWRKEWDETGLVSNKFHEILLKRSDKLLSFCNTRKENTVLSGLHLIWRIPLFWEKKRLLFVLCVILYSQLNLYSWLNLLICWKSDKNIFNRLSGCESWNHFWFLVWDWCILQNMNCVMVTFCEIFLKSCSVECLHFPLWIGDKPSF